MYKFRYVLLPVLLFSSSLFSQTPQPTVSPVENDGDVVKISTNLIQLDIVVTGKNGIQISDLKAKDFQLYENGKKQTITNLSYISANPADPKAQGGSKDLVSIPVPAKSLKLEQVRRTFVLVADDLRLGFGSMFWVRKSMKRFVEEQMREGDLVAIVRTGGGLGAIQPFTSDKAQLLAIIDKLKWNMSANISTFEPYRSTLKEDVNGTIRSDGSVVEIDGTKEEREYIKEIDKTRNAIFSAGSLGALNFIARGMKDMPGRKSMLLFSEGYGNAQGTYDALKYLADVANRSSLVIYALDPRGLEVSIKLAQDGGNVPDSVSDERSVELWATQASLRYLAEETGGLAFINQNKLDKGVREAVDDQSYYLLAYEPDSETFDPTKNRYNKISIKISRPDVDVRYRSGFFAIAEDRVATAPATPAGRLREALASPFSTNEIELRLFTIIGDDKEKGEFIRALINISAKDLKFKTEADGNKSANYDIIAVTHGIDGKPVDQVMKNYTVKVDEKTYQMIQERGFVYDLPVPIKKSGGYQFRIALRDSATGKIGAISRFVEVPKFKKNSLWVSDILLNSQPIGNINAASVNSRKNGVFGDTTLREFKSPTLLRYASVIYNPRLAKNGMPRLTVRKRLISPGRVIVESDPETVSLGGQDDLSRIDLLGALTIGEDLPPGDYIFQVIVTDELAKNKDKIASQWIDFEIIN